MDIVPQSPRVSYYQFLALPAPKIAGLLPAPKPTPPPAPFTYVAPGLAALPDAIRVPFDKLVNALLDATVGLLADVRTEAEFTLAAHTFVRQITALYHATIIGDAKSLTAVRGKPPLASPFSARRQQLNEHIETMLAQSKVHLAETRERVARELAAMRTLEDDR